jgi:hypothetical protein
MEKPKSPQQKYYEANKEKIATKNKARYEANKEKAKAYYKANKEKAKIYYDTNKEKINKKNKDYKLENKEKIKEDRKIYIDNNREKINETNRNYALNKRKTNPVVKLKHNIRSLIRMTINNKGYQKLTKTEIILGCTFDDFKTHIESLWQPWMNWDNYGNPKDGIFEPNKTWDYDHIQPMKEGLTELEVIKLNHYTNIQPLCSYHNRFIKR